jgi:hypothetical protein
MATDVNTLVDRVRGLTPDQREALASYLDTLGSERSVQQKQQRPLSDLEFCGMWRDRDDMKDSTAWVRQVRETQWRR